MTISFRLLRTLWPHLLRGALVFLLALSGGLIGADITFAERLGWKAGDVVVILHVDDVAMSRSSNLGATEAIERGVATSWAVMMPCPWVPDIARYLKQHPEVDSGLHLTLTSEFQPYRWGPLAGKPTVRGLVDAQGCFWPSVADVATHASADEVDAEIRAQLDRAETLGLPMTHLDSHMGTLFARSDYFERYLRLGIEKRIPVLAVGGHSTFAGQENGEALKRLSPLIPRIWNSGLPVIDDLHTGSYGWKPGEKTVKLLALLAELKPGVTEILFHASRPTEDFPVITGSSDSRRADLEALTNPEVKHLIEKRGIILTTWRELMQRRQKATPLN